MRVRGDRRKPERRGGGTAIARPVEGNEPDAALSRELLAKAKVQPGTRGPVEVHHHAALGITHVTDPQYPPLATYLSLPHLMTLAMHAMTTAAIFSARSGSGADVGLGGRHLRMLCGGLAPASHVFASTLSPHQCPDGE
jgi:hypothetical protein